MKQKREHFVTLPSIAAEIIATTVFDKYNTWSKPKAALDARLQFTTPFVIHDLRRTLSTGLAELQTPPHLIDCILGHAAGNLHKRYNRYRYIAEIRETLCSWQQHLLAMVGEQA